MLLWLTETLVVWDPARVDCLRIGWSDVPALELEAAEPYRWLATLRLDGLLASAAVENGPNLITGATIADLFEDLAEHWRGWSGQKVWENNEHTLRLAATHDGLGHVEIEVHLTRYAHAEWEASGSIMLDAGDLRGLARRASAFDRAQADTDGRQGP
jgi:hypothetical protein